MRRSRQTVSFDVYGATADRIEERVAAMVSAYAPGRGWEVLSVDVCPFLTDAGGTTTLWVGHATVLISES